MEGGRILHGGIICFIWAKKKSSNKWKNVCGVGKDLYERETTLVEYPSEGTLSVTEDGKLG